MWYINKNNYIIPTTSTPSRHTQLVATTYASVLNLHTHTILPLAGKEYMCFQNDVKTDQATRCIKPRIITKVIDSILSVDTFEQQCVMIKGMLQSLQLKDHAQTIGIYQSLSNNALYEHTFLESIKTLYKQYRKCDDQQKFKDILEAAMVSTP